MNWQLFWLELQHGKVMVPVGSGCIGISIYLVLAWVLLLIFSIAFVAWLMSSSRRQKIPS